MQAKQRINYAEASNSDSDSNMQDLRITEGESLEMISLGEYLKYDVEEDIDEEIIKWILCGRGQKGEKIGISLEEYRVKHDAYNISTDIDSVLASSDDIPVVGDIQYFPFSSMKASLQQHNHVYRLIDGERIRLSRIPNQMIGRFGDGGAYTLLEFFPGMRRKLESGRWMSSVDSEHRKYWYDGVLWPSLKRVLPVNELIHWPSSYDDARERSTIQGTFSFQWYWLQEAHVRGLSREVSRRVAALGTEGKVFDNRFYHIYCRGVKLRSMSNEGMELREGELATKLFYGVDVSRLRDSSEFLVDIGFECTPRVGIDAETTTMVWARERLGDIMVQFMPNPTQVRIDEFCSMSRACGVAAEAAENKSKGRFGVVYIQAYMNNKAPLYGRVSGSESVRFSKGMTLQLAFEGGEEYGKRIELIEAGLKRSANRGWSARLEVRLPYHQAIRTYGEMEALFR
jgi:hypothetical protein